MARTTRRRQRKHRGTQGGGIDRRRRTSRPRNRQEARARARKQTGKKREGPPSWSSAIGRGLFGAAIFLVLLIAIFREPVAQSVLLSALMLLIYIPLGHVVDRFFYSRRQAAQRRERERRARGD